MSPATTALLVLVNANTRLQEYLAANGNDGSDVLEGLKADLASAAADYEAKST